MKYLSLLIILLNFASCKIDDSHSRAQAKLGNIIIGSDDRLGSFKYEKSERKYAQYLEVYFASQQDQKFTCSGTYIGDRYIVTAAHCVYDGETKEFVHKIYASVGQESISGEDKLKTTRTLMNVEKIYLHKEYLKYPVADYDIALLKLSDDGSDNIDSLQKAIPIVSVKGDVDDSMLYISGFPVDKAKYSLWTSFCTYSTYVGDNYLAYECDTTGGMSGSGLIGKDKFQNNILIGVHSGGIGDLYNRGYKFTEKIIAEINDIKEKLPEETSSFMSFNPAVVKVERVSVVNFCNETLNIAVRYTNQDGEWIRPSYFTVAPFESLEYTLKPKTPYYVNAMTLENKYKLHGNSRLYVEGADKYENFAKMFTTGKTGRMFYLGICRI
ncbi:trypsin [Bacteriovorax sp. BSW11_IV]|uniref:trypsin-like serine peptidase n=1 Tax=Bacteriovorax sp. BSW11_IV TaxID=1353529 RepID=UPI00038A20D9|nr:S1 family peptidase [Bacteriovorax sp. BSW11_IV]EQC44998.1 trypsin [Bacteriovorax sp. BSW11_IV]